jgi:TonB-linked SusC/RagA family outer membrane protein
MKLIACCNFFRIQRKLVAKTLLIMKITAVLFLAFCLSVNAEVYSQKISLSLKNAKLERVFSEISNQSNYTFVYTESLLKKSNRITAFQQDVSIDKVLEEVLKGQGLGYSLLNSIVIIKELKLEETSEKALPVDIEVSGKILTEAGVPLAGASVKLKGTTIGTSTDANGSFKLSIPAVGGVLEISFVGYTTYQVAVKKNEIINIVLKQNDLKGEEVVVVGYGSVRRSDLTGAVSSVSAEKISQVKGVSTVAGALQGQAAGVQVIQRSGQPGEGMSIKIRGTNSIQAGNDPLYVVDGLPLDALSAQLNSSDIESIEVLKDASSTAIYGSRGANGVIMITTKKGKEGKSKVTYNAYFGNQSLRKKIDLINAKEFASLQNEVATNANLPLKWTQSQIDSLSGKGTDWQDLVYGNARLQNHDLSFSGGSGGTKFYTSFGYYDQDGIIENSNFKRYSFRGNLNQKISEKLTTNISLSLQQSNYFQNNYFNADGNGGVPFTTMVIPPTQGVFKADGNYTVFTGVSWGQTNPVGMAKEEYRPNKGLRIIGNVDLIYAIAKGLKLKLSAGVDNGWNKSDYYAPRTLSLYANGGAYKNYGNSSTLVNENVINYSKRFSKHNIDALAGMTYQDSRAENLNSGTSVGFLTDIYQNNNLNAGTVKALPSTGYSDNRLVSYLSRVNYTFDNKYLLTFTGRYDGSSKFSQGSKYALFPSGAIGWRVSEESFMQNVKSISNLKLRISYGVSGNQAIAPYNTLGQLSNTNIILNNSPATTYFLSRLENNSLKWESTKQLDIGFDLGLFQDRIQLTADYYDKKTTDLLLNVTLPPNSGFSTVLQNIGATANKGIEFQLLGRILTEGALKWNATLTYTSNKTKLVDLGKDAQGNPITYKEVGTGGNWFPMRIGQSMQQLYGYKVLGVYQSDADAVKNGEPTKKAGNYKFQDTDGNGVVDGKDRITLSRFEPKFSYGFNNDFSYKNFKLAFLVVGTYGNDIANEFRKYNITMNGNWTPTREAYDNRWTTAKGTGIFDKPSPNSGSDIRDYANSLWVENGSYLKVRDITLAYNLPLTTLKNLKLTSLELYISGQNLITFTNYSGYDPEVSWQAASINGWDRGNYPSTKSVTAGLKINF